MVKQILIFVPNLASAVDCCEEIEPLKYLLELQGLKEVYLSNCDCTPNFSKDVLYSAESYLSTFVNVLNLSTAKILPISTIKPYNSLKCPTGRSSKGFVDCELQVTYSFIGRA